MMSGRVDLVEIASSDHETVGIIFADVGERMRSSSLRSIRARQGGGCINSYRLNKAEKLVQHGN